MEIREFLDTRGRSPFAGWFDRLDPQAVAKVAVALTRMEQGNLSNVKTVGGGVLEYRIDFGPGYRVYVGRDGDMLTYPVGRCHQAPPAERHCRRATPLDGLQTAQGGIMALTRSFKETVKARAERDPAFRNALLTEAVDQFLAGDLNTGKAVLRDYINATIGFERLAQETGSSSKSLMRMLSPYGNPTASNLFAVLHSIQRATGVHLAVAAGR